MKNKLLFLFMSLISLATFSQESEKDELQTLITKDMHFSGFGGFLMDFSIPNDEFAYSSGGGGGLLINHKFFIGGFGLSTANQLNFTYPNDEQGKFSIHMGGLWLGYHFLPKKSIHIATDLKLGWGELQMKNYKGYDRTYYDNLVAINPGISAELNMTKWFRLSLGLGYRMYFGANNNYLSDSKLSNPNMTIGFKFGWFEY